MIKHYTDEKNALLIISILKANNIKKVIASPGTTNAALVASMQSDPFFEMFSAVDERSAAYMACGLAHETQEPVVLSCTGATASRNYMSGLTEAYYRKLPVLAITSMQSFSRIGHHVPQVIDRSSKPNDVVNFSVDLPIVESEEDWWECEIKVNAAILSLKRNGGGPAHINLPTKYSRKYETKSLPTCRIMNRFTPEDELPLLHGRIAVFVGAHRDFRDEEVQVIDAFCYQNNAVVFCDHTSSYRGKYRILISLLGSQDSMSLDSYRPDITIHIGEVSGDYAGMSMVGKEIWRVSMDGEIRDTFRRLKYVFEMSEKYFFNYYLENDKQGSDQYLIECDSILKELRSNLPEIPFSNIWVAERTAARIPEGASIHFAILNSLRSWNFFELPSSVRASSNVGGFGIDGCMSSLIGAAFANKSKIYFGVVGDLAFFYDLNCIGNRHVSNNLRIMVINNGKGTEFRQYNHPAAHFEEDADSYIAAAGHFGNKSSSLIKNYSESLGFEYISASTKEEYNKVMDKYLEIESSDRSIVFEVFTDSVEESKALELMRTIKSDGKRVLKEKAKGVMGQKNFNKLKDFLKR